MSAYLLSDKQLCTIAKFCIMSTSKQFEAPKIERLSNKLKSINIDSVNYRYSETSRKTKCNISDFDEINIGNISNKYQMLRLIECWDYQACENNSLDYLTMRAYLFSFFTNEEINSEKY
jgi:hypothetical protein